EASDLRGKRTVEILPAMSGGAVAPLPEPARRDEHEVFGSFIDETIGIVARQTRDTVSFAVGSPSREALDLVGADDLAATVIRREGAAALGYGITEGEPDLRDVIASAARDRGVAADAGTVLVSAGALQAIDLACRVYLRPGDVVVAESPAFANALSACRNPGARVLEVPVDGDGLDVAEAARRIRRLGVRPRMFFVVPNFQNPTGETLSLDRREALLALAASYDAVVVEDDPYAALRYRGGELPPLAALGGAEVVSIGTFSKTFLPGLRVGWVIAHADVIARMSRAKPTMGTRSGFRSARRPRTVSTKACGGCAARSTASHSRDTFRVFRTLSEKVWERHVVRRAAGEPDLLYVDLHLVHEVTSPQAFDGLRLAKRRVRRPDLTLATMDHNVPTNDEPPEDISARQIEAMARNAREFGVRCYPMGDPNQGIVHVISPQLGLTQPGM